MFRSRRQNFRPKLDLISESELRKRNSDCNGEQRQETTNPTKSTNAEGDCPNACMPAVNTEISSDPLTATTSHHPPVLKMARESFDNKVVRKAHEIPAVNFPCSPVPHPTSSPAKRKKDSSQHKKSSPSASKTSEIDRSIFTMADLIRYTPKDDPTAIVSRQKFNKKKRCEDEIVEETDKRKLSAVTTTPQVKVTNDGKIIVDEESLVVDQTKNNQLTTVLVDETGRKGFENLFVKRKRTTKFWRESETDKFYTVLSATGTDFSLMKEFFPGRNRRELKLKFKKEDSTNRGRIETALRERRLLTADLYDVITTSDAEDVNMSNEEGRTNTRHRTDSCNASESIQIPSRAAGDAEEL